MGPPSNPLPGVTGLDRVAAADVIARLVERSLLSASADTHGTSRFQMLETVRQYGIDRLTERGALDAVSTSPRPPLRSLASEQYAALRRPDGAGLVFAVIDAELANLRAAHAWLIDRADVDALAELAVSLFDYGFQAVRPEFFAWVEASLEVVATDDPRRAELPRRGVLRTLAVRRRRRCVGRARARAWRWRNPAPVPIEASSPPT